MLLKDPVVSVVISTYNRPELLKECLRSVINQNFMDGQFEVIVVDDGSFTAAGAIEGEIAALAEERKVPLMLLEMPENSGYQAAPKNIGIAYSRGSWIAHADDDDVWEPWHLGALMAVANEGGTDFVYSRWRVSNNGDVGPEDGSEWVWVPFNFITAQLILNGPSTNFISSHILFSKGAVLDALGPKPWNEELDRFGDWELYARSIRAGLRFKGLDRVTFTYRWHGQNLQLTRKPGGGAGAVAS